MQIPHSSEIGGTRPITAAERERYITTLKIRAERLYSQALARGHPREAAILKYATERVIEDHNYVFWDHVSRLKRIPVTVDEFIQSEDFLADQITVWPGLLEDLRRMNPDVFVGEPPTYEALLGGATGWGKTTLAYVTNAYQLYLLTCFDQPQRLYGLQPATMIVFMFQSVSQTVTKRVVYQPFRHMFCNMPYAGKYLNWDKRKESTLLLDGNIEVVPALANLQSMIGQAIIGGILDEVNFMLIIENSKQVAGRRGMGGKFDQAELIYRTMTRRRKSRFATKGLSMGTICVISSTRYINDFMDRRADEVEEFEEEGVYVSRRKQYEVQPQERFSGETFRVLVGSDRYPTRILGDHEEEGVNFPENGQVENVPIEYLRDFRQDPEGALRDVIGIATAAITPFIAQRHKIIDAVMAGEELGMKSFVDIMDVDLAEHGLPNIVEANLPTDRDKPRWGHIDLSITGDRCGIALTKLLGYVNVLDPETDEVETLPKFGVELAVSIKPSAMHELDIADVRNWLLRLATHYGLNIVEITYDGFQSKESQQALRKMGMRTREVSMDRTTEPYEYLRRAYYTGRMAQVDSDTLRQELVELEHHQEKRKVDHPPTGSKDIADAVCGSVYAAATARITRGDTGRFDGSGNPQSTKHRRERPRRQRPLGRSRR